MTTPYHAKYFAHELTKRCSSDNPGKLSQSLFNATVDLNPHQIEAALFAFNSPLSRGAILADEVGLGKTIEAGLIISQLWAERKRRILCILPAALRKQWNRELLEKFFLPSDILESRNFNQMTRDGRNPLEQVDKIILCSYQFAKAKAAEIKAVNWDLVVLDEAHRVRNVYKKGNKIARAIREAIGGRPKVLMTATPLQNSLMELYGLISFVDEHLFGNDESFRMQFAGQLEESGEGRFAALKARIRPVVQRTLRRQVTEYIQFTRRVSITQDFTPTEPEQDLYRQVSEYLQRPELFALPASQRTLITLIMRKILASSSFAITDTLSTLINRLELQKQMIEAPPDNQTLEAVSADFEAAEEIEEEWQETDEGQLSPDEKPVGDPDKPSLEFLNAELEDLKSYRTLSQAIQKNEKGDALLKALKAGFQKAKELGAPEKALIFTESRRTQKYLKELLEANGYNGQIILFNGTNKDLESTQIYQQWQQRHSDDDSVTGSPTGDMRSALVEEFRERAAIMIATESGAEGINLQFCNLIVNYDLPWNPQRIEQRIGRCHRYGQKHDVVVVNFLNRANAADQRVFELLSEKFKLFDGVFGASDEVLGALESGVDFERRIGDIYQSCRSRDEIDAAFDRLQREMEVQISAGKQDAHAKLLENFDEDVHARFKTSQNNTEQQINRYQDWLWRLTEHELAGCADFSTQDHTFTLKQLPVDAPAFEIPLGRYRLITEKDGETDHHYRLGHPLAQQLLELAKGRELPTREVTFHYDQHGKIVSLVEQLQGKSGWLALHQLTLETLETEDNLIFSGVTDDGTPVDAEACAKLFSVVGEVGEVVTLDPRTREYLDGQQSASQDEILEELRIRNAAYFLNEMEKLDAWADDLKIGLELELKRLDREIREKKKEARQTPTLELKIAAQKLANDLERRRNEKRKNLFEAQDEIDRKKESLISDIEVRLKQNSTSSQLFSLRWRVT